MADNQNFKCSGNCLDCSPAQRAYCASQHAYSNMKVLDAMMQEVLSMKQNVQALSEKIEAIQSNEAKVFDPNMLPKSVSGAEEKKPEIPTNLITQ